MRLSDADGNNFGSDEEQEVTLRSLVHTNERHAVLPDELTPDLHESIEDHQTLQLISTSVPTLAVMEQPSPGSTDSHSPGYQRLNVREYRKSSKSIAGRCAPFCFGISI
jgi:hypothetical protein